MTAQAHAIVRAATPVERAADATLHWKTGTGDLDDEHVGGWLVGWVERADGDHVFACWIREVATDMEAVRAHRVSVCRGALAALGRSRCRRPDRRRPSTRDRPRSTPARADAGRIEALHEVNRRR